MLVSGIKCGISDIVDKVVFVGIRKDSSMVFCV